MKLPTAQPHAEYTEYSDLPVSAAGFALVRAMICSAGDATVMRDSH